LSHPADGARDAERGDRVGRPSVVRSRGETAS
jgi:hypothetical protein